MPRDDGQARPPKEEPLHKSGRHSERSLQSEESRDSSQAQNDRMGLVQSFPKGHVGPAHRLTLR